jgi:cytochrome c-type biogenesis protein CcsB
LNLTVLTIIFYSISLFFYLFYLALPRKQLSIAGYFTLIIAFVFHAIYIGVRISIEGYFFSSTIHDSFIVFSCLLVLLFLIIQRLYTQPVLGSILLPVAMILLISGLTITGKAPQQIRGWWFPFHIILTYAGYSFFFLSFLAGIFYIILERELKGKHIGRIFKRLPPLSVMDEINLKCITYGFPLLTLGIITGAIGAQKVWGTYWSWDPKQVWSFIIWLLYAALLHTRFITGWRGQRIAIASIGIFFVLLFTFIGVNYLFTGLHRF